MEEMYREPKPVKVKEVKPLVTAGVKSNKSGKEKTGGENAPAKKKRKKEVGAEDETPNPPTKAKKSKADKATKPSDTFKPKFKKPKEKKTSQDSSKTPENSGECAVKSESKNQSANEVEETKNQTSSTGGTLETATDEIKEEAVM